MNYTVTNRPPVFVKGPLPCMVKMPFHWQFGRAGHQRLKGFGQCKDSYEGRQDHDPRSGRLSALCHQAARTRSRKWRKRSGRCKRTCRSLVSTLWQWLTSEKWPFHQNPCEGVHAHFSCKHIPAYYWVKIQPPGDRRCSTFPFTRATHVWVASLFFFDAQPNSSTQPPTHPPTHLPTHPPTHPRPHARTPARPHARTPARPHPRTRAHACAHAHTRTRAHARTRTHAHTHPHAHAHARTHTHTHAHGSLEMFPL